MFALLIAPRHGITARIVGVSIGGLLVVLAAALGIALQGMQPCSRAAFSAQLAGRPCPALIRPIWV